MYESFGYIFLFIILYILYQKVSIREKEGKLFGYFLIGLFSIRFIVEFVKESQGGIETFLPGLSTGQWLSIPFILIGIVFLLIQGFSELLKSYWAAKKGEWPGEDK